VVPENPWELTMIQSLVTYSLDEFLKQPETTPASEYVDGQITPKVMPQGKHSRLQKRLIYKIESVVLGPGIAEAFPELRCSFGGRSIVPDIVVLKSENIPHDPSGEIANSVLCAPDWTIEILSPDQPYKKVTQNILHCLDYGTQMGWLIDPEEKTVIVSPQDGRSRNVEKQDQLPVPPWATELTITADELFGWLLA
jgi:Uma2 family endonuclease